MSRLLLSARHLQAISRHAAAAYPEECCGFLLGRPSAEVPADRHVRCVLAARNVRPDDRAHHFAIAPETVLAVHQEARGAGLDVIGYYHSHPDQPARPSDLDRMHAWPGRSYLIVSVQRGQIGEARSWRLQDDRQGFAEEVLAAAPLAGGGAR